MNAEKTPSRLAGEDRPDQTAASPRHRAAAYGISAIALSAALIAPARAVDGCLVLLCLAAPSWRSVSECVPPVRQVLRDLARGKAFPTCAMSGSGNSAAHEWAAAPGNCPPQYMRTYDAPHGPVYTCDYSGAISVTVQGALFSRTWWSETGDAVTEFSPAAKAQLGNWETRFDDDYAAWLASQPQPSPVGRN